MGVLFNSVSGDAGRGGGICGFDARRNKEI
jgi:hypothetical protein